MPRRPVLAVVLAAAAASPAHALDADAFADALSRAVLASTGVSVRTASAVEEGGSVTLSGVTFVGPDGSEVLPAVDEVRLDGVTGDGVSGWAVASVPSFDPSYALEVEGLPELRLDARGVRLRDLSVSGSPAGPPTLRLGAATAAAVEVALGGRPLAAVEGFDASTDGTPARTGLRLSAASFGYDLRGLPEGLFGTGAQAFLRAAGAEAFVGSAGLSAVADADGVIDVESLRITGVGIGTLRLSARLRGYGDPGAGPSLEAATASFSDDGLSARLADAVARAAGLDAGTVAEAFPGVAAAWFAGFGRDFGRKVEAALDGFPGSRRTLTVAASPSPPASIPALLQAATGDPRSLPDLLGLEISSR